VSSAEDSSLKRKAEDWLAADPDPETRFELEELLGRVGTGELPERAASTAELASRFSQSLKFGTAGLRGALGAGPNRMNRVVVRQTTAALVSVLQELLGHAPTIQPPTIAVGYDGRRNSDVFARDVAQVASALGANVWLIEGVVPTPVLARLTLHQGCHAGVMITASHNPPQDNGYKVYWLDGAQIVPPHDRAIEQARTQIGLLPADLAQLGTGDSGRQPGEVTSIPSQQVIGEYVRTTAEGLGKLLPTDDQFTAKAPKCVYTPLHGVGWATLRQLFEAVNLPVPVVVPAQSLPSDSFLTVAFPNPEEPGTLDMVLALAAEVEADVVLANDPDADRLAVALRQPDSPQRQPNSPPQFRVLSGNELGVLFADGLLGLSGEGAKDCLVGTTIVSAPLLEKMAAACGAKFGETLTGFKWLARLGDDRPQKMLFGYEEALGYSVLPELVRDKDGISAAVLFVLLMQFWTEAGTTPVERLRELAAQHGLHLSSQLSFRYEGDSATKTMAAIMGSLRSAPPRSIGSVKIVAGRDYAELPEGDSDDSTGGSGEAAGDPPADSAAGQPVSSPGDSAADRVKPANVLTYYLQDGSRIILRPSGTEPKLKVYLEVIAPAGSSAPQSQTTSESQFQDWQAQAERQLEILSEGVKQLIAQRGVAPAP